MKTNTPADIGTRCVETIATFGTRLPGRIPQEFLDACASETALLHASKATSLESLCKQVGISVADYLAATEHAYGTIPLDDKTPAYLASRLPPEAMAALDAAAECCKQAFWSKLSVCRQRRCSMSRVITPAKQTFAPLQNYYGGVSVFAHEGKHFMALGDVAGNSCLGISEALYRAFVDEFDGFRVGFLDQSTGYTLVDGPLFEDAVDEIIIRWTGDCGHTYWNTDFDYFLDLPRGNVTHDSVTQAKKEIAERFKDSPFRAHISY